jgi:hypothetical protein
VPAKQPGKYLGGWAGADSKSRSVTDSEKRCVELGAQWRPTPPKTQHKPQPTGECTLPSGESPSGRVLSPSGESRRGSVHSPVGSPEWGVCAPKWGVAIGEWTPAGLSKSRSIADSEGRSVAHSEQRCAELGAQWRPTPPKTQPKPQPTGEGQNH